MLSPSRDYYRFVNETWLQNTPIPADAASTNISRQIAEKIEKQLISVVKEKLVKEPGSNLSRFVRSIYATWDNPRQTEYRVVELIGQLLAMQRKEDVGLMIGKLNKLQARAPIILKITTDSYNTQYYRLQISEYVPCVPNRNLLIDAKYAKERDEYRKFVNTVGNYFGIANMAKFIDIEIKVAHKLPTLVEEDDTPMRHNLMKFADLQKQYPDTPWSQIMEGMGVPQQTLDEHELIITSPKYLEFINDFFMDTNRIQEMNIWLLGSAVMTMGRFISGKLYNEYFHFYGKVLKGAEQPSHVDRIMMTILTTHLPQLLSKEYTIRFVSPTVKEKNTELVLLLKKAAIRRINLQDWLSPETKTKATEKISKMGFKIAYPDVWREEGTGHEFSETQLLRNLFAINEKDTNWAISDIGPRNSVAKSEYWDTSTYEVNAFYYPDYNEMVIPAGILQPPFYDPNKSMAWNLGGIGNVISHEMTHGFDSEGVNHNADGNYAPWFNDDEKKEYERKAKQIEKLFSVEYMGAKIDGELTLMENIADLGGVSISLEALRLIIEKGGEKENKKMLNDYFSAYAVSWRNKDRKKKAELSSKTDKHAPPELRVNKIISQFPEFYSTYNVREGDNLWVSPEKRVTIW
jgi:predicted metalloendopeptidase